MYPLSSFRKTSVRLSFSVIALWDLRETVGSCPRPSDAVQRVLIRLIVPILFIGGFQQSMPLQENGDTVADSLTNFQAAV